MKRCPLQERTLSPSEPTLQEAGLTAKFNPERLACGCQVPGQGSPGLTEQRRRAACCGGPLGLLRERQSRTTVGGGRYFRGGISQLRPPAPLPLLTPYSAGPCGGPLARPPEGTLPVRKQLWLQRVQPLPVQGHQQPWSRQVRVLLSVLSLAPNPAASPWNSEGSRSLDKGHTSGVQDFQPRGAPVGSACWLCMETGA